MSKRGLIKFINNNQQNPNLNHINLQSSLQSNIKQNLNPNNNSFKSIGLSNGLSTGLSNGLSTIKSYEHFERDQQHDKIFVSIASYRDPETINTITDLFNKAKYPGRVFIGICQQNAPEDNDCLNTPMAKIFQSNIRILRLSHFEAKGPMYARHLIEKELYQDEMFYLQLDSHMLLTPNWDEECILQLAMCPSDKPILTTYPHDFDRLSRKFMVLPGGIKKPLGSVPPTFLRFREFHPRLQLPEQEKEIFHQFPDKPFPSLLWAAGFSFSLGSLIREVPYDPNCPFVFVGEETSMGIRYYTHGWDLFSPCTNIVYHLLKRTYRKTFWEQVYKKNSVVDESTRIERRHMEREGLQRIHMLIKGLLKDEKYNIGTVRSIQDWENYVGIILSTKTATERAFQGVSPDANPEEWWFKHGVGKSLQKKKSFFY